MFSTKHDFSHRRVKNLNSAVLVLRTRSPGLLTRPRVRGPAPPEQMAERKPETLIFKQAFVCLVDVDAPSLKRAGTLLFLGTGQFAFFFVLAEIYYPGYDVSSNVISDLGATCKGGVCKFVQPSSDIFNASIVLMGVLLLFVGYYLRKGSGSRALPLFEALAGVGAIGVGVFNESFGAAHVFFSAFTFVAAGIQALLVYKVAKAPFSYFSALAGMVTLVATVLYATDTYLGLGQGGMERVVVYPVLIGGIAFGGYLMALGDAYLP
jgi:hypothetical membrane protein